MSQKEQTFAREGHLPSPWGEAAWVSAVWAHSRCVQRVCPGVEWDLLVVPLRTGDTGGPSAPLPPAPIPQGGRAKSRSQGSHGQSGLLSSLLPLLWAMGSPGKGESPPELPQRLLAQRPGRCRPEPKAPRASPSRGAGISQSWVRVPP